MSIVKLQKWLQLLISGVVSFPDDIVIKQSEDEQGVLFTIEVHEEDRGKVIGKKGAIANAIRVVLRSAGRLLDVRASMKILIPGSNFVVREK